MKNFLNVSIFFFVPFYPIDQILFFFSNAAYRVKDEILKNNKTRKQCGFDVEHQPKADEVCTVVLDQFGECTLEKNYSYPVAAPCVFIKLNRVLKKYAFFYLNFLIIFILFIRFMVGFQNITMV